MIAAPLAAPLVVDPLADLADAVDGLQAEDLRRAAGCELGPRLRALRTAVNRLEAEASRTLEAFDRSQAYAADGAVSAVSWLRHRCNLSYGQASHQVHLARRLPELPRAGAAFASGEISSAHVSLMARAAEQVGMEPVQAQEAVLVEAARDLDPRMFRHVTEHLRHCVDPDGALRDADRAHERGGVWLSQTMEGGFVLNGALDAEEGSLVSTALAATEGPPRPDDLRPACLRRKDALVDLARHRLDAGDLPSRGGQKPHLVVTAELDTLAGKPAGAATLNWEQLVPAATARRLDASPLRGAPQVAPSRRW
jgi:hypothetical protein